MARRLVLTGEVFDIDTAVRIGLVHEVRAEAELDIEIDRLIGEILKGGPQAIGGAKALMRRVVWRPVTEELLTETAEIIAEVRAGAEAREGVAAFLEKRPAAWVPRFDDDE